ncbi:TPA: recombinase family protein [Streptococcus pyogenes]|jgi:site-specific DNA recombinase|uniref:recombinase family protein n=1 Tax=Streptococcus TaxID=1301 RepID=UPI0007795626|nr:MULTISPECIES: recombinase family protein [Streptococcus]QBX14891.1 site-specific recombinase [Streptococcus phage Javan159]QBX25208.1 site-specific recombinase [Streptococcus phage Javan244]DAK63239.1 MAG TPA: integrase [Caudoviricetes sp.]HEQ2420238.1 recombinase family protein [Streptococcus pyogenes]KAF1126891.1 recombinase family protein [Streptococcus agalactiae]
MKNVITIGANAPRNSELASISLPKKRRVAGYARVSTDHEDQTTSYESQMKYYTEYISSRSDWEFVKMYSDEGISGTNTKLRVGFKSMIEDALAGKIDLIITKSVSRFARNTVDSLTTVRKLKEVGVEIYFEKENIWTLDSKGELLITIMSSLAQEESRSISENVTWGLRKQFAEGKVHFPYTNVMGFEKGENGEIVVNQEDAKTVRYIFQQALLGKTPYSIAKDLTQQGILSPSGKNHWSSVTIKRMLRNEKYKGDALLQKTYTIDFLSKKKNINKGELPQYYVENNHEAIVDKETFDAVQATLDRKEKGKGSTTLFSSKLVCGDCGHYFGSKVWHSTSKYRRVIYQCNEKYKGEKKCTTPHVTEDEIKDWFVSAINKVISNKDEIISNLETLLEISGTADLEQRMKELETEVEVVSQMISKLVTDNAVMPQNQDVYQEKYRNLVDRYDALIVELESVEKEHLDKAKRNKELQAFLKTLKSQECLVTEFDDLLWETAVERIIIKENRNIEFIFKNGEVTVH